jgi:hypothetical protein
MLLSLQQVAKGPVYCIHLNCVETCQTLSFKVKDTANIYNSTELTIHHMYNVSTVTKQHLHKVSVIQKIIQVHSVPDKIDQN